MEATKTRRLTEYSHGAGCACKLSPLELAHVLSAVPGLDDPNVLASTSLRDDAAVYMLDEKTGLVATVDFFTPIVDDPGAFGAIAAANSLSDVYAVGGAPLFALSLVCFPRDQLDTGVLEAIVSGGAEQLRRAGIVVVGGHSVDDPEPKFGYAVIGRVEPKRMLTHAGASPGDVLYLTKPLGTGVITTAIKRGVAPDDVVAGAIAAMTHLNRNASTAMLQVGATAATDVTGYGLLGHLANLQGGAEVYASRVPFLPGARELAEANVFPSGTRRNLEALAGKVEWHSVGAVDRMLLADAQTSGGLLVAVPDNRAADFETCFGAEPFPAARIGRVTQGELIEVVA